MLKGRRLIAAAAYGMAALAVIYLTTSLILCLNNETAGHAFGMLSDKNRMLPGFADLRAITALAGCDADINLVMEGKSAGCDPYGRSGGLGYPPLIYELARGIGVTGAWTGTIAVVCGITFMAIVIIDSKQARCSRAEKAMLAGILLMSFPAQLAMERMNIDVIIFIGLRIVAWLRNDTESQTQMTWVKTGTAAMIVAALGGSKVYPSIGVLAWLTVNSWLKKRIIITDYAIAAGAVLGIGFAAPWILSGDTYAVPPISLTSHGLIGVRNGEPLGSLKTLISISAMAAGNWGIARQKQAEGKTVLAHKLADSSNQNGKAQDGDDWMLLSFMTWITSYCITTSFDYRLIFLFPLMTKLASEAKDTPKQGDKTSVYTLALAIALAYLYTPLFYMWIESSQQTTWASSDWWLSVGLSSGRYGLGALSRLLDLAGIPYLAGVSAGYVLRPRQRRNKQT